MADDNLALTFQGSAPDTDFDAIHDAFMDTERGRWFLVEFARRNRHADTALLLAAIGRIESILLAQRAVETLPRPQQDPAALANPPTIKPHGGNESKSRSASDDQILRVLGESVERLRAAIAPLRDVSWSMREQGDMRCEVLDRQAIEIAQACAAFDALRQELGAADDASAVAEPTPILRAEPALAAQAEIATPEQIPVDEAPEPPPAQTFARAAVLDTLPPAREPTLWQETPAVQPEPAHNTLTDVTTDAAAEDPFEDMLFEAEFSAPEVVAPASEDTAQEATAEGPFNSSQAKRLTRLINLFAGARAPDAVVETQHSDEVPAPPVSEASADFVAAAAPVLENAGPQSVAALAPVVETAVDYVATVAAVPAAAHAAMAVEATSVAATPFEAAAVATPQAAPSEPADFLLEPWPPRVAVHTPVQQPTETSPAVAIDPVATIEPAPVKESAPSPAVTKASHFPMSRQAPSDPLAPILALSDEEKIALFS